MPTESDARSKLDADDYVGNALCDALLESPNPSVIRVLNWHGDWAEAAPNWTDFRSVIGKVDGVVAKWPVGGDDGVAILLRSTKVVGQYERVRIDGDTTDSNVATVSGVAFEDLFETAGPPRLVPEDDVRRHFEDGGQR